MTQLSIAIGRQCRPKMIVITTEHTLLPLSGCIEPNVKDSTMPYGHDKIDMLDKVNGYCRSHGGDCTSLIHIVAHSVL